MAFDDALLSEILGTYRIKCVKPGGYIMQGYGGYDWEEGEVLDLLAPDTPDHLRANSYQTARDMCTDPALELAQCIKAGDFELDNCVTGRLLV